MGPELTASDLYRKLQSGFCPAVRSVAQSGAHLLSVRSAYSAAFNLHLSGLQELAQTGSNTSEESSRYAAELNEITRVLSKVNAEDDKLFESFGNLIIAVNKFSESEKERLKEMNVRYAKDEKVMIKTAKQTEAQTELQEFYVRELRKAKEQHAQRYAYFAKNYLELLRKYAECAKRNVEAAEKKLLDLDVADAVKRLDEVVQLNDTIKSTALLEETMKRVNSVVRRDSEFETQIPTPKLCQSIENQGIQTSASSHRASKITVSVETATLIAAAESRSTAAASRASTRSELSQLKSEDKASTDYPRRDSPVPPTRKVLPPNIYRPTPILGNRGDEIGYQNRYSIESPEVPKIPCQPSNSDYWKPSVVVTSTDARANRTKSQIPYEETRPDFIADSRPVPRTDDRRPPPEYKPSEKPAFAVSDYGRTLECVQEYTTQSDHQLSMEVGDRMQLVKSGNRGWVLGRTSDQRQGWFPARYLKIL